MYTEKELKAAAGIITQIAREHHVPEEQVRSDMREAMSIARNDPSPAVRAQWASFHYAGTEPTPEELIAWLAVKTKTASEGCAPAKRPF